MNSYCVLCNDPITSDLNKRSCGHKFHQECLNEWNKNFVGCPNCNPESTSIKINQSSPAPKEENNNREFDLDDHIAELWEDDSEENRIARREAQERLDNFYRNIGRNGIPEINELQGRINNVIKKAEQGPLSLCYNFLLNTIAETKFKILFMSFVGAALINKFIIRSF